MTLNDQVEAFATAVVKRQEREYAEQLSSIAGGQLVAFYPDDWIRIIHHAPRRVFREDTQSHHFEADIGRLCPASLYNHRLDSDDCARRFAAFMDTGKIPPDCPELRRVVAIRNTR